MEEELDLFELLEVLKNRWRFLLGLVLIAVLVAGVVSFFILEPVYEAKAVVILKTGNQQSRPMVLSETAMAPYANLAIIDPVLAVSVNNVVEVLRSRAVLSKVIGHLGLEIEIPSTEFDSFNKSVKIEPQKGTTGIIIEAQSNSPIEAQRIVNTLLTEGVAVIREKKAEEISNAHDFLQNQLNVVNTRLNEIETALDSSNGKSTELKRQLKVNEELHTVLLQKLTEMQVLTANYLDPIEFIDEAIEPVNPIKPNKALNIIIAAFLAFFVGVFWVFLEQAWANRRQTGAISS